MTVSVAQAQLFFLAFTRMMAMLIHVPVLGGVMIPNQVKLGLGIMLVVVMIPWQLLPPEAPTIPATAFGAAILQEILIGTIAGFGAALTFGALQLAGNVMGIGSGFRSAQMLNPTFGQRASVLNNYFMMVTTLLFLVVNGHHVFLLGVSRTFTVVPLNSMMPDLSSERLLALTANMIMAGVQIALPILGSVLLADLTLGLLARVAPQVHVFFLGVPIKVGLGLLALTLSFGIIFPLLVNMFQKLGDRTLVLLGA